MSRRMLLGVLRASLLEPLINLVAAYAELFVLAQTRGNELYFWYRGCTEWQKFLGDKHKYHNYEGLLISKNPSAIIVRWRQKIFEFGGNSQWGRLLRTVESYDINLCSWSSCQNLEIPTNNQHHSAVALHDVIWLIGCENFAFSPKHLTWLKTKRAGSPPPLPDCRSAFVV